VRSSILFDAGESVIAVFGAWENCYDSLPPEPSIGDFYGRKKNPDQVRNKAGLRSLSEPRGLDVIGGCLLKMAMQPENYEQVCKVGITSIC